jgi:hypothetical protein
MFVTTDDLKGELYVDVSSSLVEANINSVVIPQIEEKYLRLLLGDNLYRAFIEGYEEETPVQKWADLAEGALFEIKNSQGKLIQLRWLGCANMLKYFVCYEIQLANQTSRSTSGNQSLLSESAELVSIDQNLIVIFNKGVDLFGSAIVMFNDTILNDITDVDFFANYSDYRMNNHLQAEVQKPSAFNFIYQKYLNDETVYPNWYFTNLGKRNPYGF